MSTINFEDGINFDDINFDDFIFDDSNFDNVNFDYFNFWRSMIQDPRLKEVFPKPPLVAYKRPKNIRDTSIRSKVPPLLNSRP